MPEEWSESRFPLYTLISIQVLYCTSSQLQHRLRSGGDAMLLLVVAGGSGQLQWGMADWELTDGGVLLLPARTEAMLIADRERPLHLYKLLIGAREPELKQPEQLQPGYALQRSALLGCEQPLHLPHSAELVALAEELYAHRLPVHESRHIQNQLLLHQLLLRLIQQMEQSDNGNSQRVAEEQPSMERSIAHMERHYSAKLSRSELAALAGVSPAHYSIQFKQRTGLGPKEYLSRLRVHRAKELLTGDYGTLRDIALQVGYKDEFYLSRRFKQQTGASPTDYYRGSEQRIAVLLAPYASHVLLLGVKPAVMISDSNEYMTADGLPQLQELRFIDVCSTAEQLRQQLLESGAELLIAAPEHLREYGLHSEQLRVAAPVIEIPWMPLGWQEHLRLIARAIHRTHQAEQWLAAFSAEEHAARERVLQHPVHRETVAIIVVKPGRLLLYGARNAGYVVYRSLALRPPISIGRELERHGDQFHSIVVEPEQLMAPEHEADRLLVIVFPDSKGSVAHAEAVFGAASWRALPAVRSGAVHRLEVDDWIPYNPVSIRLQLQRAEALFSAVRP